MAGFLFMYNMILQLGSICLELISSQTEHYPWRLQG